jgi:putative tryptophan/tyrosine transport system substrate-binding protein
MLLITRIIYDFASWSPPARVIALLTNPNNPNPWIGDVQQAARLKGVQLQLLNASSESEIDAAFATLVQLRADGLIIGDDVFFTSRREQLVALASRYSVPAIERWREFAASGGLISYGPSLSVVSHRHLRREDTQGRKARGFAGCATD